MENPFGRKKSTSPQPMNSFQRELAQKMKDRKRLGLSADMSGSDEELASDDELMSQFNLTSKSKNKTWAPPGYGNSPSDRRSPASNRSKSPFDSLRKSPASDMIFGKKTPVSDDSEDDDDNFDGPSNLMMTMKKPWNPSSFGKDASKTLPNPKIRKSKAFDGLLDDDDSRSKDKKERTWTPPSFKKELNQDDDEEKENRLRPKSPNVRRKTPTLSLDSIEEEGDRPTPKARHRKDNDDFRKPQAKPRGSQGRLTPPSRGYQDSDDEDDEIKQYSARGAHGKQRKDDLRRTPTDGRKTPGSDGRRTPSDGKVNIFGRQTPGSDGRRTPAEGKVNIFGRQTPDRHTPYDERSDERTKDYDRKGGARGKSPKNAEGRRSPHDGRKTPDGKKQGKKSGASSPRDSSPVQKKSMLDMYSSSSTKPTPKKKGEKTPPKKSYLQDSSSEDEGMGAPRRSPSPMTKGRKTPDDGGFRLGGRSPYGQRRGSADDHGDEVDGFRRGPSLRSRDSPLDEGPSLRKNASPFGRRDRHAMDEEGNHGSAFRPTPARRSQQRDEQEDRGRPRSRGNTKEERDSSLCRDVEEDPSMRKEKEHVKEKKLAKAHTAKGRKLDDAIISVENAQDKTMKFISPDDKDDEKEEEEKSPPPTKTFKHRPKPRYAKPVPETTLSNKTYNFNSTTEIKQAVYDSWYTERMEKAKKELKEKKAKERELEKKKEKEKEDKVINASASYQAWMESKKDYDRERKEKARKEEEKKRNQATSEEDKKKDAYNSYKMWKENKDVRIHEMQRKKQREEEEKRRDEANKKKEKEKDSERAFSRWKENKDNVIRTQSARSRREKNAKQNEELEEKRKREETAMASYDKWMSKKERQQQQESYRKWQKTRKQEMENKPAWSPANRTIPVGR